MDWLQSLISGESGSATQLVIITAALVVGLIVIVWLFRRIASAPKKQEKSGKRARLSVTDVFAVDDKRFLVLVRRDDVEHLVMIGGPSDVVVETGIGAETSSFAASPSTPAVAEPELSVAQPQVAAGVEPVAAAAVAAGAAVAVAAQDEPTVEAPEHQDTPEPVLAAAVEPPIASEIEPVPQEEPAEVETVVKAEESTIETPIAEDLIVEEVVAESDDAPPSQEQIVELDVEDDANLEAAISENLEDALSIDQLDVADAANTEEVSVESPVPENTEASTEDEAPASDDEMQKLLDELAGEKKEPAQ